MHDDFSEWLGASQVLCDEVTAGQIARLDATLDRPDQPVSTGAPIPLLYHWLLFAPTDRPSQLGPDGYARRGFLPRLDHMPRQVWGGARIRFHAPIRVGMAVERRSEVVAVTPKTGGAGKMVVAVIRHEITARGDGSPLLTEEADFIYRGISQPTPSVRRAGGPDAEGRWRRTVVPDDIVLFRYSALTFNSHRIHFNRDYTTGSEGYCGLVVHGPLLATLLADHMRRHSDAPVASLTIRAAAPCFDGEPIVLCGEPRNGGTSLWARNADGDTAMRIEAESA